MRKFLKELHFLRGIGGQDSERMEWSGARASKRKTMSRVASMGWIAARKEQVAKFRESLSGNGI
jgi:hypothetical protein